MRLLTVEAAQRRIVRLVSPVTTETLPVLRALGRVLARNIKSIQLPRFDNSSVDGFAVRSADVRSASRRQPSELRIVADIAAGIAPRISLTSGQAARINTGAPIPRGADCVIMQENTDHARVPRDAALRSIVRAFEPTAAGANVRRQGSDARAGRVALGAGTVLRPQELGLISMLGERTICVYRRPLIAVLSSGNELQPAGTALRPGAVFETNSVTLAGLASSVGCDVLDLGVARDSIASIEARLKIAVRKRADLIVTSAGVSVGSLDLVRDAIRAHGRLIFWRVNVRPGKPLAVGRYEGIPLIGLPGNPVSAFVGFELFVLPAIQRLRGQQVGVRRRVRARLLERVTSDGRESYLRATVDEQAGEHTIHLTGHQGSGNLLSLVEANALLVVPAGVKSLAAGNQVEAWLL